MQQFGYFMMCRCDLITDVLAYQPLLTYWAKNDSTPSYLSAYFTYVADI